MATIKSILVPLDFSEASFAALDFATDLAERLGSEITVLHAFEIPMVGFPDGLVAASGEVTTRIANAAQKGLDDAVASYKGRKVKMTSMLKQGDPRDVILATAKDLRTDLITIGTHGRRGIARALLGSVAETTVRASPVPVLTVHGPTGK